MQTVPNARPYLPDIDGLRALAVLAVVLFHLDVPGLEGGYVGVDIFFVISGFLISGILVDRINCNALSFSAFYSSRIRRLLPAVLATVAATAVAAVILLQPLELQSFGRSALAAIFSAANFVFYAESGYWDSDSALKPLLHMWSLGVEEQFYLFWPALVWLFIKIGGQRGFVLSMCLLLGLSLSASIIYTTNDQPAAFFLLPFRVWQFCLGALAMVLWRRQKPTVFAQQLLRSAGLALCCVAVATFADGSQFPGWLALIPSIGAAMVLVGSSGTDPSPILGNGLARWLGRVSYSMYLVHWPPIALYLSVTQHEITDGARLGLGILTLALTVLLHYGVENRFYRRGEHGAGHWDGAVAGSLVVSALLGLGMTALWQYPDAVAVQRVPLSADAITHLKEQRFDLIRQGCLITELNNPKLCPSELVQPILFIGNSHEPDGFNFMTKALPDDAANTLVRFQSTDQCGTLIVANGWVSSSEPSCQARLDALHRSLDHVNWSAIIYSANQPFSEKRGGHLQVLRTIKSRQPNAKLVTVGGYINTERPCAQYINRFGTSEACKREDHVSYWGAQDVEALYYADVIALTDLFIDRIAILCPSGGLESCLTATPDGVPMFVDRHHLSLPFAQYAGSLYKAQHPNWYESLFAKAR